MNKDNYKIAHSLLCDDVREEKNGKHIYIGVYSDKVIVSETPYNLRLYCAMSISFENIGEHKMNFKFKLDGKEISTATGALSIRETGHTFLNIPILLTNQVKGGVLTALMKFEKGDWHPVLTKRIVIRKRY